MLNFLKETIVLGVRNLWLHKLRSTLTALGIIFGVLAFIVMVAIGEGAKEAASEQMNQLGKRNILLVSTPPPSSSDNSQRTQRVLEYGLRRDDLMRLQGLLHTASNPQGPLTAVVPLRDTEQKVTRGDVRATANAFGTTPAAFEVINLRLARGRYFNQLDYDEQAAVCVIGATPAQQLFPYEDPLGQQIKIGSSDTGVLMATIIGVLEHSGLRAGGGFIKRDLDWDVYIPLSRAQSLWQDNVITRNAGSTVRKSIQISEIWLQTLEKADVEKIAGIAENIVKQRHEKVDYEVKAPIQILRAAEETQRLFNFVMGGISCMSLLVGGIGIMNIMLASVTERTREIGIRRALGAKRRHVILQFLIETTVISLSGGAIGILIAVAGVKGLPEVVRMITGKSYPMEIATWSIVASVGFSALIGIGFGLYPAVMAAKKNPIEALRHE